MAFKMKPTGGKKDPYSSFQRRGLLSSPMKQKSTDELNAEAKIIAQGQDWQTDEYGRQYRSAETEDTVEGSSNSNEPKMSNEDWIKFKVDYEKKHGKPWKKPGSTNTGSYIEFKEDDIPEVNKQDFEVESLATFLGNQGIYQPKDMYTTVQKEDGSGYEKRKKTDEELEKDLAYHEDGEGLMQAYRDHLKVKNNADSSKYDDVNQGRNVVKGTESSTDTDSPDEENASGKTIYDAPVNQLSPTRQLMNKYMPKKSMAKQEKIYKTDTKKMVKDYGALPSSSSKDLGIESFAASGSTLPEIVIDSNKNKKSVAKQKKEKKTTNYKFKDGEANVSSESKVNRRFRPDRHKIKA